MKKTTRIVTTLLVTLACVGAAASIFAFVPQVNSWVKSLVGNNANNQASTITPNPIPGIPELKYGQRTIYDFSKYTSETSILGDDATYSYMSNLNNNIRSTNIESPSSGNKTDEMYHLDSTGVSELVDGSLRIHEDGNKTFVTKKAHYFNIDSLATRYVEIYARPIFTDKIFKSTSLDITANNSNYSFDIDYMKAPISSMVGIQYFYIDLGQVVEGFELSLDFLGNGSRLPYYDITQIVFSENNPYGQQKFN